MTGGRVAYLMAAMLLAGASLVTSASSASANKVWHQSVGRASADAACPVSSANELAAGWTQWGASWAAWPNGGKGGYTCDRKITWAFSTPEGAAPTGVGCVLYSAPNFTVNFVTSNVLPNGSPVYSDPGCATALVGYTTPWITVWMPIGATEVEAQEFCPDYLIADLLAGNIWECKEPV